MEILEILIEGIKYALPAVIVLLVVKYMNDSSLKKQHLDQNMLMKNELLKQHMPMKVSAYERAVLYLERISPQNILMRMSGTVSTAQELHAELMHEIRSEYEHNIAQQIYISPQAWLALIKAKEEMMTIINVSMSEMEPESSALDLSKRIVEKCANLKEFSTQKAIFLLKSEVQAIFKV